MVDSAPVLIVSDSLTFSSEADVSIISFFAGKTETDVVFQLNDVIKQNKLPNPGLVLNGEKINSGSNYTNGNNYEMKMQLIMRMHTKLHEATGRKMKKMKIMFYCWQ